MIAYSLISTKVEYQKVGKQEVINEIMANTYASKTRLIEV